MKIKVLEVVPTLNCCGGIENYIMNYFRVINREKFTVDFAFHKSTNINFIPEILSLGGRVHKIPEFKLINFIEIKRNIKEIILNNNYDVIHCHMANAAFLYLKIAKECGVKIRIIHSHQSKASDKLLHSIRNYPLLSLGKKYANVNLACSTLAGDFLFKNNNYFVINNAIDTQKYSFNYENRIFVREKYNVNSDEILVGNIGRCSNQKNQIFLLDLLKEALIENVKIKLIIIGDGDLLEELKSYTHTLGINDNVIFIGAVDNTSIFYSAMDVFVMPSLYEGLPVVGVEAQYNGLKLVVSNNITKELNFTNRVTYLDLKESKKIWLREIIGSSSREVSCKNNDYDILYQIKELEKMYSCKD